MLIKEKKATIINIHILFLRDTVLFKNFVSLQQSAALGPVSAPETMVSTSNLLFRFKVDQ